MESKPRFDWLGFFVQFFFGALFGAAAGFGVWAKSPQASSPSMTPGFYYMGIGALLCGLIASWFGAEFWRGVWTWVSRL